MSETEDDDGGIDKEALREELREKYAEDDTEREATQRMSDLLLKGATMTNSHCNTCGDPLFQQNGTTFCPTCHGGPEGVEATPVDGGDGQPADVQPAAEQPTAGQSQTESGAGGRSTGASESDDVDTPAARRSNAVPSESADASAPTDAAGVETHGYDPDTSPTNPDARRAPDPSELAGRDRGADGASGAPDRRLPPQPADGDRDGAADSLQAALERFAREAATTDDPRYARDCLEAAHEAADALAALRR